jgi:hypothetical protein
MFCCDVSFVCTVRSRNGKLSPYGYIMCRENRSPATYCLAWCGVNFWLRGPRLTASCHWNDQVLSMLMCLVVVGLGASLSFGFFFLPLLWTSFSCPKKISVGSLISRSFMRLMSPSVCLSMYHPRTFFCKIMRVFGKSSDLSRVSAPC